MAKGQALDNARTERSFRTIKYDLIYINEFVTPIELSKEIAEHMAIYNNYSRILQSVTDAPLRFTMPVPVMQLGYQRTKREHYLNLVNFCLDHRGQYCLVIIAYTASANSQTFCYRPLPR